MKDGTWEMNPNPALNHSWTNYTACWDPPDSIDITYHALQNTAPKHSSKTQLQILQHSSKTQPAPQSPGLNTAPKDSSKSSNTAPKHSPSLSRSEHSSKTQLQNTAPKHSSKSSNTAPKHSPPLDLQAQADKLTLMYTVGYSVSLATLLIAVFIMLYCRRLRCKSNTMHINLFVAFILRASMAFLKDRLFVGHLGLPQDVTNENGRLEFIQHGLHWECRLITVLFMFSISATQTWILMEGLYLYMLIHRTIVTERYGVRPYILIGWITPWLMVIPWIIVKHQFENTYCWNMQENRAYLWILNGPWVATVMINFFFFLDIFRVLFMRVRSTHRHVGNSKYRKFAKFILVLIPLFGIMYIILFIAFPADDLEDDDDDDEQFNVVHLYIEMGYNSFQGFILALLFCFLNEDVHSELRRMWRRHKSRREDSKYLTRSLAGSTFRPVSRDHNSPDPAKRVPRSVSNNSWRKKALSNSQRGNRAPAALRTLSASQGNVAAAAAAVAGGERHPLFLRFSAEPFSAEASRMDHASSTRSLSAPVGILGAKAGVKGTFESKTALVRVGNGGTGGGGGGGGVPARILLISSQTSVETTTPLSCSAENMTSSSVDERCGGILSES
ncbi:hypothetical protein ACOMHN_065154 [Nucella lapillus]